MAVVALGLLAGGCSKSAEGIATADISASLQVEVRNDPGFERTQIAVWLNHGLTDLILPEGEHLSATLDGGAPFELPENSSNFYNVDLPQLVDAQQLTIALTRRSEASAPASTIALAPPLALSEPVGTPTLSYASDQLTLTWSNPITGAEVRFDPEPCDGAAFNSEVQWVPDTGSYVIPASALSMDAPGAAGQCVSLEIQRRVPGTVDHAFHPDSHFEATRFDYLQVDLVP